MTRTMLFSDGGVKAFSSPEEGDRTMPDLNTKRILVTQSDDFMGPAICAFLVLQLRINPGYDSFPV